MRVLGYLEHEALDVLSPGDALQEGLLLAVLRRRLLNERRLQNRLHEKNGDDCNRLPSYRQSSSVGCVNSWDDWAGGAQVELGRGSS